MAESVVVMPVAKRPEFMALSLQALDSIPNLPHVIIFGDYTGGDRLQDERIDVYQRYAPEDSYYVGRSEHIMVPSGCWNILKSLVDGYNTGAEYVFLVEEDVVVTPQWLTWSLETLKTGDYLATCGRRTKFNEVYGDYYTNPGACLTRRLLAELTPHVNDDYFTRLRSYMDEKLPPKWDEMSDLDDGLIRRVIRSMGGKVAYPDKAVVAHQGYWAYEERFAGYYASGNVEERVTGLRKLLATLDPKDRYTKDLERL